MGTKETKKSQGITEEHKEKIIKLINEPKTEKQKKISKYISEEKE